MFRFTIRDVLWLFALATCFGRISNGDESPPLNTPLNSSWVVSDCYSLGKPNRSVVGTTVVFRTGHLYLIGMDGEMSTFDAKFTGIDVGDKFELSAAGRLVAKVLAFKTEDGTTLYMNYAPRSGGVVEAPQANRDKCSETIICLPLPEEIGQKRLDVALGK